MAFGYHKQQFAPNRAKSAVNSAPIAGSHEHRTSNPVYRQCFTDGRQRRIAAERAGDVPSDVPLYSHNTTRQGYFTRGWHSVSAMDLIRAEVDARLEPRHE